MRVMVNGAPPQPPEYQDPTQPYPGFWAGVPFGWMERFEGMRERTAQGGINVVFLGDSITEGWDQAIWAERYAPLDAVNYGIGGDQTSQLLYRIAHGLLDGITPRLVVLKIGVNNMWDPRSTVDQIADGIATVVAAIRAKLPNAQIVVIGILPHQASPDHELRAKTAAVNAISAGRSFGRNVQFLDIGDRFVEPDSTISSEIMPDYLHLSRRGYEIFADAIQEVITPRMNEITVSDAELASGSLSAENLRQANRALREDGFVVLADIVDLDHVAVVRDRMWQDLELLLQRPDAPFNWNTGNVQQDPPPFAEYLFRDILVNDIVIQVTESVLGPGLVSAFYSGNTAMPSEHSQPVHADSGQLWPNLDVAPPPYALVVNLPLVDVSAKNASTEIWPGTHLDTSVVMQHGEIKVSAEALAKQAAIAPPLQPVVRAGSVVIRDMRLWHRGMPNYTDVPRPMMAMIHYVAWWPVGKLRFPKGTEAIFEHPVLRTSVEFVDEAIDHISAPGGFEYTPEPV